MARRRRLEETLDALRAVRGAPRAAASLETLRAVLQAEGSHAVARAAAIVGEHQIEELAADLVAAFPRFFEKPERSDPGCGAKTAIVQALRRLDRCELAIFRRGAGHVQMEPVFGGRVDTAVDLRGASALALAEQGGSDVLVDLAHLLADPEPPVRISAARALAAHGRDGGIPLLHLKALAGDSEPRVVSECLLSLVRLEPGGQLGFVASFLAKDDARAEAAALALGDSRRVEALPILRDWLDAAARRGLGRAALLAIAALRRDEAVAFLLQVVRDEPPALARQALVALASVGSHASLVEQARRAAQGRPELLAALERAFGSDA